MDGVTHSLDNAKVWSSTFTCDDALLWKATVVRTGPKHGSPSLTEAIQNSSNHDPSAPLSPENPGRKGTPLIATRLPSKTMRLYTPPERWNEEQDHDNIETYHPRFNRNKGANQIETYDPARPFALAPCQACGFTVCDDKTTCTDHESPIVIAIGREGKFPTACGVFCNINSIYNTTFMLHDDKLGRSEADLHAAVAALKQVQTFITTKTKRNSLQSKRITQIIIKTKTDWLGKGFAGSTDHYCYRKLSLEFDNLVDELGEHSGIRPVVKFWKVPGRNTAQQLAEATLRGWEEAMA